jgi:hypothetical protein
MRYSLAGFVKVMQQGECTPVAGSGEPRPPVVVGLGLFLGASALALSVVGIVWRLNVLSVAMCLIAASLVPAFWVRRVGACRELPTWALVLCVSLLVLPAIAATAPPNEWDEVAYGAALPRDYAAAGRFFYNADYGPVSAFPGNYEALATAALVLVGDVTPVRVLSVLLALGLAVIAVHLSRRVGVAWPSALIAAMLVLSAPALLTAVPLVKNDVANAFFQGLALLSITSYATRRELRWLALGGFFLGTALGVKYTSLGFAVCVAPLSAVLILAGPGRFSRRLRDLGVFAAVALAAALPWYARNYFVLDNPIFPFSNELLRGRNGLTPETSAIIREWFGGWFGYNWQTSGVGSFLRKVARGFGRLPLLLAVPGLLAAALRRRDAACTFLGATLVSFGLFTLFAGSWLPRYFLSLLILSSVFAAAALEEIFRALVRALGPRAAAVGPVLVALAVAGSSLWLQWRTDGQLVRDVLFLKRQKFVRTHVRYWEVADWANRHLGPQDKIGLGVNIQPFFYLKRPHFHIHPGTEKGNLQSLTTPEEFLQAFRALDLTWLAFSEHFDARSYPEAVAPHMYAFLGRFYGAQQALVRSGKLTLVASVQGVRIYRIEPPAAPATSSGR